MHALPHDALLQHVPGKPDGMGADLEDPMVFSPFSTASWASAFAVDTCCLHAQRCPKHACLVKTCEDLAKANKGDLALAKLALK